LTQTIQTFTQGFFEFSVSVFEFRFASGIQAKDRIEERIHKTVHQREGVSGRNAPPLDGTLEFGDSKPQPKNRMSTPRGALLRRRESCPD
jgi:hypothetical protein